MNRHLLKFGLLCAMLLSAVSCGGYYLVNRKNYFANYNISSLCVPLFINNTLLPGISPVFTQNLYQSLAEIPELKLYSGLNDKCDAVLIGTLNSGIKNELFKTVLNQVEVNGTDRPSLGSRNSFRVPTAIQMKMGLSIVVVRNRNRKDLEKLTKLPVEVAKVHPLTVLTQNIPLSYVYTVNYTDPQSGNRLGLANYTRNKYQIDNGVTAMAENSARVFKQLVINAF